VDHIRSTRFGLRGRVLDTRRTRFIKGRLGRVVAGIAVGNIWFAGAIVMRTHPEPSDIKDCAMSRGVAGR
jgi:hypothetical protein